MTTPQEQFKYYLKSNDKQTKLTQSQHEVVKYERNVAVHKMTLFYPQDKHIHFIAELIIYNIIINKHRP